MTEFIQTHYLTFYPPSNPNRDDIGRPKSAIVGNSERLRISSQALKHAVRKSDVMASACKDLLSVRTKQFSYGVTDKENSVDKPEKGKEKKLDKILSKDTLASLDKKEIKRLEEIIQKLDSKEIKENDLNPKMLFLKNTMAIDTALFGRMLANSPEYNIEAAAQVAHAFTVNAVSIEDDYFTGSDDWISEDQQGAGHIGATGFSSGLFYLYCCINKTQFENNLDESIKKDASSYLQTFIKALAICPPSGKSNSFANRTRSEFILLEQGDIQPRSLAGAYYRSIDEGDLLQQAIKRLLSYREKMDKAYQLSPNQAAMFSPVIEEKADNLKVAETIEQLLETI